MEQWQWLTTAVGGTFPNYALGTAMAAVGLSTSAKVFQGVGMKPFAAGLIGALMVGSVGAISALVVGPVMARAAASK